MRTTSFVRIAALGLVASTASAGTALADTVQLRLATMLPEGTAGLKILEKSAAELESKTEKRLSARYYAGGVQGDERDIMRKLGLGELDGAALTASGLAMIDSSIQVLELPRLFATVEELDHVADKMWTTFQQRFAAKGYRLLDRGDVGWIHVLSRKQVTSVATLKAQKMHLGDDTLVRALFFSLGVAAMPGTQAEVVAKLTTGQLDAAYGSPLTAVALEWSSKIKYLSSLPLSYAIGGTIVRNAALDKVSASDQALLAKLTSTAAKTLRKQVRKDNEGAKKKMELAGVVTTEAPVELVAAVDKAAKDVWKALLGKVYNKADLDLVLKYRDEYRAKNPTR